MNDYPNTHIQLLKTKYTTLLERLQKRLHNGEFSRFTRLKQQALFRRLHRYERQLKQWGIAIATGAALLLPPTSMSGQVIPTGTEFRVNTFTANTQLNPSTAMDMNGHFVVTWEEVLLDGSGAEIYAQRYNSAGVAQGNEFLVNTYTTSFQRLPSVAMDSDGDFVISWSSALQDGHFYGVYAQRYNSMGIAQGSEFKVNSFTTGNQNGSSVAMDSDGDFVITWESGGQDNGTYGIYAQRYNSAGVAQGSEFRVNTYTTSHQNFPSVAMDSDGDFVISWHSSGQDGQSHGIYAQRYNNTGIAQGSEFKVNTLTTGSQNTPSVAMDSDGNFVVAWQSNIETGGAGYGVYAQRYNNSGLAQGSEFHVNTYTTSAQSYPAVAMDSDGDFVISWHSDGQDGSNNGVYVQRYNNTGIAQGSEFKVNTYTTNSQWFSSVAMNSGGDFVIAWVSFQQVGSGNGIYAQRFITCTSQNWYADTDGDGYGAGSPVASCTQPPGMVLDNTDCNTNNNAVHPGATEICNGIDDNCDNAIDNVTDEGIIFYHDNDMDGYGDPNNYTYACSLSAGFTTDHTDCNDNNAGINPGATEISGNNVDDNCNGSVDEIVLARIEYFFDADPGYGNGISIPVSGNAVTTTFEADLSTVSTGVHFLYVRTQDSGGRWSETAFRVFYKPDITTAENPALTRLEYFFDTDPGYGNGISVALSGTAVSTTFDLDLSTASTGIHFLYIRTQDSGGHWSETAFRLFYKPEVVDNTIPDVVYLEYFLNADPGYGNGISVPVAAAQDLPNINFAVCLFGAIVGNNRLFVRTQDSGGRWSETAMSAEFVVDEIPIPSSFFYADEDQDGYGTGTGIVACTQPEGTVTNNTDNCPSISNADQADFDGDAEGDVCDADDDNDGDADLTDCAPFNAAIHHSAVEICNNSVDDNCDGLVDENCGICIVNIPDLNFKTALLGNVNINTNSDGEIQCSEATSYTGTLDVSYLSIADLTGIEAFTALTTLYCNGNPLMSLDISANTALTVLDCSYNQLSDLDISNSPGLYNLYCSGNSLMTLDVSANTSLNAIFCGQNSLSVLDLSAITALSYLSCSSNQLSSLDLSTNTMLIQLECSFNQLTSLDLSANTALTYLSCSSNQLTELNVQNGQNANIFYFNATNNPGLVCILVDDVAYSTANWTNIDPVASFSLDCIDNDNDGIDNELDNCPSTSNTDQANNDGDAEGDVCDADDDNDGDADLTDCAPFNAAIHNGATEVCNSVDDNCNDLIDDDDPAVAGQFTFYADMDEDGYGAGAVILSCSQPANTSDNADDCDDSDMAINPGAPEITGNLVDDNCNGSLDECTPYFESPCEMFITKVNIGTINNISDCSGSYADFSNQSTLLTIGLLQPITFVVEGGDQYISVFIDLNDNEGFYDDGELIAADIYVQEGLPQTFSLMLNATANPGSHRMRVISNYVADGSANDPCGGTVLGEAEDYTVVVGCLDIPVIYYVDDDSDGYGDINFPAAEPSLCPAIGFVYDNTDCDDANFDINPGATEYCDFIDNDCNELLDDDDPFVLGQSWVYFDNDGDLFGVGAPILQCFPAADAAFENNDCDDNNVDINPFASEVCNTGIDEDCDGLIDNNDFCCPVGIAYVNADATGLNNGTSWADAYTDLNYFLENPCPGVTQVWVAAGTYKPTTTSEQYISFEMRNDLAIYGGFAGNEPPDYDLSLRNFTEHETVLSGDIGNPGFGDNSYFVVQCNYYMDSTAVLDGFSITGAEAPFIEGGGFGGSGLRMLYSSPIIENCTFMGNMAYEGGGINGEYSSPSLKRCVFTGNQASKGGAVSFQSLSYPRFVDCIFRENTAIEGGAVYLYQATQSIVYFINCIFSDNTANSGSAIANSISLELLINCTFSGNFSDNSACITNLSSNVNINNCIFWDNNDPILLHHTTSNSFFGYSIVQGGCPAEASCFNILNSDPLFISATDLHLQAGSPAINSGYNTAIPSGISTDLDGNQRIQGTTVDMGCYEANPCVPASWYADNDNDGYGAGAEILACEQPANTSASDNDCDDADMNISPAAQEICNTGVDDDCDGFADDLDAGVTDQGTYYTDDDDDGYGTGDAIMSCLQGVYSTNDGDCNDNSSAINPGATELCNSVDDNCDGFLNEGFPTNTYYQDNDHDGKGNPAVSIVSCYQPVGYVTNANDCDDNSTTACPKPSAMMTSAVTDVSATVSWGYLPCATKYRLEYRRKSPPISDWTIVFTTSPTYDITGLTGPNIQYQWRVATICSPNGTAAESGYASLQSFYTKYKVYTDADMDGFGDVNATASYVSAMPQPGYSLNQTDCDDAVFTTRPGAPELCNGIDDDCDLIVDEGANWYQDADGDGLGNAAVAQNACQQPVGYVSNSVDCNDNSIAPACSTPNNVTATNIGSTFVTINWSTSPCASSYTVMYRIAPSGAFSTQFNTTGSSLMLTGLLPGTTYQARVRAKCPAPNTVPTSNWVYVTFTTNGTGLIEEVEEQFSTLDPFTFGVYPNPGDGRFILSIPGDTDGEADISVLDGFGKLVHAVRWSVYEGITVNELDLTHLPGGVYHINIRMGDMMQTKKVVIVR